MHKYRAKQLMALDVGSVVELDAKQAGDRKGRVEHLGEDRYRLKESLQFKAGESFGFDGELPKPLADAVEDLDPPAPAPAPAPAPGGRRKRSDPAAELHL